MGEAMRSEGPARHRRRPAVGSAAMTAPAATPGMSTATTRGLTDTVPRGIEAKAMPPFHAPKLQFGNRDSGLGRQRAGDDQRRGLRAPGLEAAAAAMPPCVTAPRLAAVGTAPWLYWPKIAAGSARIAVCIGCFAATAIADTCWPRTVSSASAGKSGRIATSARMRAAASILAAGH